MEKDRKKKRDAHAQAAAARRRAAAPLGSAGTQSSTECMDEVAVQFEGAAKGAAAPAHLDD
jgi:hypothetical protein